MKYESHTITSILQKTRVLRLVSDCEITMSQDIMLCMDEEEMRKMVEEMAKISNMPKAIFLKVQYDKELQKITGKEEHPLAMSEGSTFAYLLQNIFMEYPELEKQYPPGVLGFSINGFPPKMYTPLFDGDTIIFSV